MVVQLSLPWENCSPCGQWSCGLVYLLTVLCASKAHSADSVQVRGGRELPLQLSFYFPIDEALSTLFLCGHMPFRMWVLGCNFAGRSGIFSSVPKWESPQLQQRSCIACLWPTLSTERPSSVQGMVSLLVLWVSCIKAAFLTYFLLCCVGQFSEEKIHLSILNETGSWLENKVLPLLQDQEEEFLKLRRDVYQQVIQVSSWDTARAVFPGLFILL